MIDQRSNIISPPESLGGHIESEPAVKNRAQRRRELALARKHEKHRQKAQSAFNIFQRAVNDLQAKGKGKKR